MKVKKRVGKQKRLTRREVKNFRKSQGWRDPAGRRNGGAPRGYSRSYVKAIEGGSLPISRFFEQRFRLLRAHVIGEQVLNKE